MGISKKSFIIELLFFSKFTFMISIFFLGSMAFGVVSLEPLRTKVYVKPHYSDMKFEAYNIILGSTQFFDKMKNPATFVSFFSILNSFDLNQPPSMSSNFYQHYIFTDEDTAAHLKLNKMIFTQKKHIVEREFTPFFMDDLHEFDCELKVEYSILDAHNIYDSGNVLKIFHSMDCDAVLSKKFSNETTQIIKDFFQRMIPRSN